LLGEGIDLMVQTYIRKEQERRGGVSSDLVIGAATGMLKALDNKKKFTRTFRAGQILGTFITKTI